MRRLAAALASALALGAACGRQQPPAWDAWLQPGEIHCEWARNVPPGTPAADVSTVHQVLVVTRTPEGRHVEMRLVPEQAAELVERVGSAGVAAIRALSAPGIVIPDDAASRPAVSVFDEQALRGLFAAAGAGDPPPALLWPETRAWQKAEAVRWWYALGIPWIDAAQRGESTATLALPVVGHEVEVPLALGASEEQSGEISCYAVYRLKGTDARDVEAVFLRQLRERGEVEAAAHTEVEIEGVFRTRYDAATRRPISCAHSWSTISRDRSTGIEMKTDSMNLWIFSW